MTPLPRPGRRRVLALFGLICAVMIVAFAIAHLARRGHRLHDLAESGDEQGIRAELSRGADPNARIVYGRPPKIPGVSALMLAARSGSVESVRVLIDAGADISASNALGEQAIHYATADPDIIDLLIQNGADPNAATGRGDTPICRAARIGQLDSVVALIRSGANILGGSCCPLEKAARRGHVSILRVLLENAPPNWGDDIFCLGEAVIAAAAADCLPCIELLLARGADVNIRTPAGETALMQAAERGGIEAVRMLLQSGADPRARNNVGHDAIDYAGRCRTAIGREIEELLIEAVRR
jgi:uncharacterized protein